MHLHEKMSETPLVLVVGGVVADTLLKADTANAREMHDTSTPSRILVRAVGGVGWNIARTIAKQSTTAGGRTRVAFATVAGSDVDGDGALVRGALHEATRQFPSLTVQVDDAAEPTAAYIALLGADGELAAAAAVMHIFEAAMTRRWLSDRVVARFGDARAVVLDGNVPPDAVEQMLRNPPAACGFVWIDPISKTKARRLVPLLRAKNARAQPNRATLIVKPNEPELLALAAGLEALAPGEPFEQTACRALAASSADVFFCTRGAHGVLIVSKEPAEGWTRHGECSYRVVPAVPLAAHQIVKVTGAGDALSATATLHLVRCLGARSKFCATDLLDAAVRGVQASASVLTSKL